MLCVSCVTTQRTASDVGKTDRTNEVGRISITPLYPCPFPPLETNVTRFRRFVPSFTGIYRIFLCSAGCTDQGHHRQPSISLNNGWPDWVILGYTGLYWVILGYSGLGWDLVGFIGI